MKNFTKGVLFDTIPEEVFKEFEDEIAVVVAMIIRENLFKYENPTGYAVLTFEMINDMAIAAQYASTPILDTKTVWIHDRLDEVGQIEPIAIGYNEEFSFVFTDATAYLKEMNRKLEELRGYKEIII